MVIFIILKLLWPQFRHNNYIKHWTIIVDWSLIFSLNSCMGVQRKMDPISTQQLEQNDRAPHHFS